MLAHYVIGFEFLLLASIFWYAFVRQPEPFKFEKPFSKGTDPWGVYERRGKR